VQGKSLQLEVSESNKYPALHPKQVVLLHNEQLAVIFVQLIHEARLSNKYIWNSRRNHQNIADKSVHSNKYSN
jgi:hypothetical protein